MLKRLIVKSRKQHIRLWFEFYKLALQDPDLAKNIEQSRGFYSPWGDVNSISFDDWWKTHRSLFGVTQVEVVDRVKRDENTINLAIPLNLPISSIMDEVKRLVGDAQTSRLIELGIDPRTKKTQRVGLGHYELTDGVEIRGKVLHETLIILQIWVQSGRPPVNENFVELVRNTLKDRPVAKWVPMFMIDENPLDPSNVVRQMRRRIERGKEVCRAVSKGEFPGKQTS